MIIKTGLQNPVFLSLKEEVISMRYPKFIKPGDKIDYIAVSFGCASETYEAKLKSALRKFEKLGYKNNVYPNAVSANLPYLASTPDELGRDFNLAMNDDSSLVLSVGGGEFEVETLEYSDFTNVKEKWFSGFSDNTNHCFNLLTKSDMASLYGCCAGDFGQYNWYQSIADAYDLLTGKKNLLKGYPKFQIRHTKYQENHILAGYHLTEEKILTNYPIDKLEFKGRLIGGCIDCLLGLCGTKYDNVKEFAEKYKDDGFIWFLEACDLDVLSLRRAYIQLKNAGWFKYCKGFLIGRPQRAFKDDIFEINRLNAIDVLKDLNVPIVADFDLGHIKPTMPLILGSLATVKVNKNDVSVLMELV